MMLMKYIAPSDYIYSTNDTKTARIHLCKLNIFTISHPATSPPLTEYLQSASSFKTIEAHILLGNLFSPGEWVHTEFFTNRFEFVDVCIILCFILRLLPQCLEDTDGCAKIGNYHQHPVIQTNIQSTTYERDRFWVRGIVPRRQARKAASQTLTDGTRS